MLKYEKDWLRYQLELTREDESGLADWEARMREEVNQDE